MSFVIGMLLRSCMLQDIEIWMKNLGRHGPLCCNIELCPAWSRVWALLRVRCVALVLMLCCCDSRGHLKLSAQTSLTELRIYSNVHVCWLLL